MKLTVESYLFEDETHQFRAIPFYELSIDEWVVYQDGKPKYLIDFNRRDKPIIQFLAKQLRGKDDLDSIVNKLGKQFNQYWTTKHNIDGDEIADSWQVEQVTLELFDGLENWGERLDP